MFRTEFVYEVLVKRLLVDFTNTVPGKSIRHTLNNTTNIEFLSRSIRDGFVWI